jgi:apolipoprotein N-acyltransferase
MKSVASPPPVVSNAVQLSRLGALCRSTLATALAGSLLLFAALPPLGWWPLAWLAPIPWVVLIRRRELPGRHAYLSLWLAGAALWLSVMYWLTLPYPWMFIGWLALSFYLACYLPLFVALSRVAVHRLGISSVIAAPVVWCGLEFAQAHFLTGFSIAGLGQSQYRWISLIQTADLAGVYGVSFLVMLGAACLARLWPMQPDPRDAKVPAQVQQGSLKNLWPLACGAAALGAALLYGQMRLGEDVFRPGPTVALIQGSIDTEVKSDETMFEKIHKEYMNESQVAVAASRRQQTSGDAPQLDLIVWPETMFRFPLFLLDPDVSPPPGENWDVSKLQEVADQHRDVIRHTARSLNAPMLLGIDVLHFGAGTHERFNSALLVTPDGEITGRYDKLHPVMFGEYIPFAKQWPWLARITPIGSGLDAGRQAEAFDVAGAKIAPNICYESTLSHLIRGQVDDLRRRGQEPDLLVNQTNDGWFWGSSELDLHLICGVFRAIECRKPFLIAANTGFSAWIDSSGRILDQGPRRKTGFIIAKPQLDSRASPYVRWGDWFAGACLAGCLGLTLVGTKPWFGRFLRRKPAA